ncbi:MAG: apolipoprotein N-acyltransferase [Elusimicrobia bacterium]|nr:apolipoprotein N-acyltransferase [Elusimicrobiota bacterium]
MRLRRLSLALLSGGILGAGYWPGSWGVFAWAAYVPLLWVVRDSTPRQAFLWGMAFSGAEFAAATPWLYDVVRRWLELPAPARAFCFAALCAYHGLMAGLACAAGRRLAQLWHDRRGTDLTAAAAAFMVPALVAAEGFFPRQFPAQLAETQLFHLPSVQLLEAAGPAGLAWLIIGFNAALYLCFRSYKASSDQFRRYAALLACVVVVLAANEAWGRWRMSRVDSETALRIAQGRSLRVGMVQGRLPHDRDYLRLSHERDLHAHNLSAYDRLSREALASGPLDLLIWPGNILPDVFDYGSADSFDPSLGGKPLGSFLRERISGRVPTMFYTVGRDRDGARRWAVVLTSPSQEPLALAEKMILTPFGDYTPGGSLFPFLRRLNPNTRAMSRGTRPGVLRLPDKARIAVLICYEDLVPGYAAGFLPLGAEVFADIAGNSWDDTTMLPYQHMRFAALRAVENRRYLLRSTISGVSAVIDPAGRIVQSIGAREEGVITTTVALLDGQPLSGLVGRWLYRLAAGLLAGLCLAGLSARRTGGPRTRPRSP